MLTFFDKKNKLSNKCLNSYEHRMKMNCRARGEIMKCSHEKNLNPNSMGGGGGGV